MLDRYSRPQMRALWSEQTQIGLWFEIELAAVEAWAEQGVVPSDAAAHIRERAVLDIARMREIEEVTRHDVAAFVQSLEEAVGPEHGRWIHFGMTSSDVLDTALAIQLRDAADLLLAGLDELLCVIELRAWEHRDTPRIGRSHAIHAEPTTLGHAFASWHAEVARGRERLEAARATIAFGKLSGAVGTFSNITPTIEAAVCSKLGLQPDPVSTQVVSRDRHAHFIVTLALLASTLERIAVEVRHMQRTEVGEAEEKFHTGQKGSSAMPHKRNPVLSENVTGLARVVRTYATAAMENVALWHERDISHSSVERVIAPDATSILDFAIHRTIGIVRDLVIYPERALDNLALTRGLPFSQSVLSRLIVAGSSRDEAYRMVQRVAMRVWEDGESSFEAAVRADAEIASRLSAQELDDCFSLERTLAHLPDIFARVFGEPSGGQST